MNSSSPDTSRHAAATSQPPLPRAISTLRFVTYMSLVTGACLAWTQGKFWFATPALGISGVLLRPRAELLAPMTAKLVLITVLVAAATIAVVGFLVNLAAPFVLKLVTKEQLDAIGMHPVFIALAWLALVYTGASAWRGQLKARDA